MATLILAAEEVKLRFEEQYVSEALNRAQVASPVGIYRGFLASAVPATTILDLDPDPTEGDSVAVVSTQDSGGPTPNQFHTTIRLEGQRNIDLAAEVFPVDVVLEVTYEPDDTVPTEGRITTLPAGTATHPFQIKICEVDQVGPNLVVTDDPSLGERNDPLARLGQGPFGFMPAGSVEDLEAVTFTVIDSSVSALDFEFVAAPTAPTLAKVNRHDVAIFDAASLNQIEVRFVVPGDKRIGDDVTLKARVSMTTADPGEVRVLVSTAVNGAALGAPTAVLLDPNNLADTVEILEVLNLGALAPEDDVVLRFERDGADGSDDHTGNMRLFDLLFEFPVDIGGGITGIDVEEAGTLEVSDTTILNFEGANVVPDGPKAKIIITGAGGPVDKHHGTLIFDPTSGFVTPGGGTVNEHDVALFDPAADEGIQIRDIAPSDKQPGDVDIVGRISMTTGHPGLVTIRLQVAINGAAFGAPVDTSIDPFDVADTVELISFGTLSGISPEDDIIVRIARLGTDGADTHTGEMRLFDVLPTYESLLGPTGPVGPAGPPGLGIPPLLQIGVVDYSKTDEPVPSTITLLDEYDAAIFPKAFDTEIKFQIVVPSIIGGIFNLTPFLRFSMSSALVGTVAIDVEYRINGGAAVGPVSSVIAPSALPGVVNFLALGALVGPFAGRDDVLIKVARRTGSGGDTHLADLQLRSISIDYPTV